MILAAQAVPSAALVPCVAALPAGWSCTTAPTSSAGTPRSGWILTWRRPGVAITLSATCDVSGARQVRSDQPGTRRFDRPLSQRPQFAELRFYTFPGGCVSYQFNFTDGGSPLLASHGRAARWASCPGPAGDTSRTPKAWRCAGGARHVRADARRQTAGGGHPGRPGRDVAVTAAVLALTAVAFAAVADHGILVHIQRVDNAWLRLMVSGRSAPVTVMAKFFNLLGWCT